MIKSKKGISPLIATVLILGFTVALAAVIMIWGTKFTKDIQENTGETATANIACAQDLVMNIQSVCEDKDIEGHFKITIANNGNADIDTIKGRFYSGSNIGTKDISDDFLPIYSLGAKIVEVSTISNVVKIELIPSINVNGKNVSCSSNMAVYEGSISACPS